MPKRKIGWKKSFFSQRWICVYWVRNNVGGIVYYLVVFKDGLNFLLRGSPLTNPPLSTSLSKVKKTSTYNTFALLAFSPVIKYLLYSRLCSHWLDLGILLLIATLWGYCYCFHSVDKKTISERFSPLFNVAWMRRALYLVLPDSKNTCTLTKSQL